VHVRVEVELVLETAAAAADHAQAQVDLLGRATLGLLVGDDLLDLGGRLLGQDDRCRSFDRCGCRGAQGQSSGHANSPSGLRDTFQVAAVANWQSGLRLRRWRTTRVTSPMT